MKRGVGRWRGWRSDMQIFHMIRETAMTTGPERWRIERLSRAEQLRDVRKHVNRKGVLKSGITIAHELQVQAKIARSLCSEIESIYRRSASKPLAMIPSAVRVNL